MRYEDPTADNAIIYFLALVDTAELAVSSTYYIDEDIEIADSEGHTVFHINSGTYNFEEGTGTVSWNNETIPFNASIDVTTF